MERQQPQLPAQEAPGNLQQQGDQPPSAGPQGQAPARDALSAVDARLGEAHGDEIVLLTQVRAEIIRQDEMVRESAHRRRLDMAQALYKMVFSLVAVPAGALLTAWGFRPEGFFVLGAGLFWLAPSFTMRFLDRLSPKRDGGKDNG